MGVLLHYLIWLVFSWYTCAEVVSSIVSEESDDLVASNDEGVDDDGDAMSADYSLEIFGTK